MVSTAIELTPEQIRQRAGEIKWFHTIDLGNGIVTKGADSTLTKLPKIGMPTDLTGKSVLDIGAWDGAFSFEAERRSAKRVLAIDSFSWNGSNWGSKKKGFEFARQTLHSKVEDREMEVLDLSPDLIGTFDVVFFLGVLYHMKYPLLALEHVASVASDMLILETAVDLIGVRTPAAAFYRADEFGEDDTNWWAPNPPGLYAMLQAVGFKRIQTVCKPHSLWRRTAHALDTFRRKGKWPSQTYRRGRITVHAWK